jgi:hypothetical protein
MGKDLNKLFCKEKWPLSTWKGVHHHSSGKHQSNHTPRPYFIPTGIATIKKPENSNYWKNVRILEPEILLVEMWNAAAILENSLAVPQTFKHKVIIWPAIPLLEKWKHMSAQKHIHECSYSIVQNRKKCGNNTNVQMSMRIIQSKKVMNYCTCHNLDEPWKPVTKVHVLYHSCRWKCKIGNSVETITD